MNADPISINGNLICFGLLFAFFSVWAFIIWLPNVLSNLSSRNWTTTSGNVIATNIVAKGTPGMLVGPDKTFESIIKYEYEVSGHVYDGTHSYFDKFLGTDRQGARHYQDKYLNGNEITVFYDPRNPAKSVLRSKSNASRNTFIIGFTLLVIAVGFVLFGWF